ncbi:TPA: thiamine pyrophosphate-binding protein [Proteus mirabilis]|uniref:alpha-keto acid decarboxylase family protein n=1 Tax=Proteus sp. G2674 TaxID=2698886 RepID=UPI001377DDC4|nr:thiamine pyrophosphate-binding protein [Proteus sp. G2674]NBL84351.1 alpha-keto acid decarboxylase family protein [Proteus sp. G2674]
MITVLDYLLVRLKELEIKTIFGVPGDYNLPFIGVVDNDKDIQWVGACNELNASYACEGYARIKGFSALCTTYGVGELSAINGVAGAFAEQVPIIHIVGAPSQSKQEKGKTLHHCLATGRFDAFEKMYRHISKTTAVLTYHNATEEIDRVLETLWRYRYPVYLLIPEDVGVMKVNKPKLPLQLTLPQSNPDDLNKVITLLENKIKQSKSPCIIIGEQVSRYQLRKQVENLLEKTNLPFFTVWGSKGVVDEGCQQYGGILFGELSNPQGLDYIINSDLIISLGVSWDEVNTAGFTFEVPTQNCYQFYDTYSLIEEEKIYGISLLDMPNALLALDYIYPHNIALLPQKIVPPDWQGLIKIDSIPLLLDKVLDDNSVILAEAGNAFLCAVNHIFSGNSQLVVSNIWASIGYTLPAALGVTLALENQGRAFVVIGDGAFQMTAQELSTLLRLKLNPVIFIVNNQGYAFEKIFYGPKDTFNDIQNWNYSQLPELFNCDAYSVKVDSLEALETVLPLLKVHQDKLCLVELDMDKHDYSEPISEFIALLNQYK